MINFSMTNSCCLEIGSRDNKVVPLAKENDEPAPGAGWPRIVIIGALLCAMTVVVFGTLLYIAFDAGQPFGGERMLIYGCIFLAGLAGSAGLCGFACGKGWNRRSHLPRV